MRFGAERARRGRARAKLSPTPRALLKRRPIDLTTLETTVSAHNPWNYLLTTLGTICSQPLKLSAHNPWNYLLSTLGTICFQPFVNVTSDDSSWVSKSLRSERFKLCKVVTPLRRGERAEHVQRERDHRQVRGRGPSRPFTRAYFDGCPITRAYFDGRPITFVYFDGRPITFVYFDGRPITRVYLLKSRGFCNRFYNRFKHEVKTRG